MANKSTQRHLAKERIRRKAADEQITTTNKVLSATPDHLYLLDPDGRYLFASESAAERHGIAQADFLGKTWQELGFPAESMAPFTTQLQAALASGQTVVDEILFPVSAGERWFEYVIKPLLDQQGVIEAVIVTSRDITERRRAADNLRQLAAIVESSGEAIFSKTLEGVITSWNGSAEMLFGYRAEEIIGKSVSLLIPPDDQQELGSILARTKLGQQPIKDREMVRIRKDGTAVTISATISPVQDYRGHIIGSSTIAHDMSEQKRIAEDLAKRNSELERALVATYRLAAIVESSGDAIISKTLEGVITSWNSSAERLYGYGADEVIGKSISLIIPSDRKGELPNILERIRMGEIIQRFETVRERRDGTFVEVSLTVSPIRDVEERIVGASTITHDITTHKRMEKELATRVDERERIMHELESLNQQLYGLFAHAPAGFVLFDANAPYQVLLHNTFFQEFFPEPFYSEGMLGKYLPEYVPRAEEDGVAEVFRQVVSTKQSRTLFNFVYDGMPQGRTWWNWHLAPIIKDGEVTALTQMVIETTHEVLARQQLETELAERKRAEDALKQSHDELVASNMALEEANLVRSQFIATMSHELRTPLASITGFSELLLDDAKVGGWSQQQQSDLERILTNSGRLLDLINDVLDLSKLEAGQMMLDYSWVDVKSMLNDVAAEIASLAIKQNLFLKTEVQEDIGFLETNPLKLHQILLNLVSNALKFTEHGGVTLSVSRVLLSDKGVEGMAFAVQDSGIGIPPNIQEHIFEAFYQADMSYTRRVGGTGLGLSIVSQLTTLLGGTITVASVPGQGSTFTVTLPVNATHRLIGQYIPRLHPGQQVNAFTPPPTARELAPAPSPDMRNESGKTEATERQHNLILVVDDNPDAITFIKAALQDAPYTVLEVQDPLTVMELAQKLHPCAITLDVLMPKINGWQLLHQLKDNPATASIPIIMLTVLRELTTGYVLGADYYLIKPFKKELLRDTLRRLFEAKQGLSEASK